VEGGAFKEGKERTGVCVQEKEPRACAFVCVCMCVCVENLSQRRKIDEASALRNGTVLCNDMRGLGAYVQERKIDNRERVDRSR
jgi:hypothetical protein